MSYRQILNSWGTSLIRKRPPLGVYRGTSLIRKSPLCLLTESRSASAIGVSRRAPTLAALDESRRGAALDESRRGAALDESSARCSFSFCVEGLRLRLRVCDLKSWNFVMYS